MLLIPLQVKWLPLTLGLMFYSLVWLVTLNFGQKLKLLAENRIAGLFLLYLLWIAIGTIYSDQPGEALKYLTMKVPFAAWPILMCSVALFYWKDSQKLLNAFVYSLLAAVLLSFGQSLFQYLQTGDDSYLYFSKLIHYDRVPPHYFGMYINFGYGVVFYRLLQGQFMAHRRWLSVLLLMVFFLSVIFISVRMQYIVFVAVNILVLFGFKNSISLRARLIWTVGALVGLFLLAWTLPGSRSRLVDTVNEIISFEGMVNNKQTNPRKFLWKEGWQVVKENFWLGTGTGAEDYALQEKLADVKAVFWDGSDTYYIREKGYNYHNTYLQHWAAHGIIGLLILLAVLAVPYWRKGTPPEARIFLAVCAISFLTESMLQRQAGVLFFTFFYGLFFFLPHGEVGLKKDEAT